MVPVVFAVFANDEGNSLSLKKEKEALERIFDDNTKVQLVTMQLREFDRFEREVMQTDLRQRIIAFHFGGHSNGQYIKLVGEAISAKGLAKHFSMMPNLQLVFLNGCESFAQAKAIQDEGVQAAVLTTLRPLKDDIAVLFADYFYVAFYSLNTLSVSFQFAEARIVSRFDLEPHRFKKLERSIGLDDETDIQRSLTGNKTVYVLAAPGETYLNKNLLFNINYVPVPPADYSYVPNRPLIESLTQSILNGPYVNQSFRANGGFGELQRKYGLFRAQRKDYDFKNLVDEILQLLPYPLSYHIGILMQNARNWKALANEQKIPLLERQVNTYESLVQLLGFALLSSFWNEFEKAEDGDVTLAFWNELVKENDAYPAANDMERGLYKHQRSGGLAITPGQREVIRGFMNASLSNRQEVNYPALIITIRQIFEANDLNPFIAEYRELRGIYETEEEFFNVHLHMQGLKACIESGAIKKLDVNWLCYKTEEKLRHILAKAGFMVQYKLTTVKNIEIAKSRRQNPQYYIQHIFLDGQEVSSDDISVYPGYTDSRSMILAKGTDLWTFTKFITLSPFIIDENAIRGVGLTRPFFFSHSEGDAYVYCLAKNPEETLRVRSETYYVNEDDPEDPMRLVNKRMEAIKQEMDEFKKLINLIN